MKTQAFFKLILITLVFFSFSIECKASRTGNKFGVSLKTFSANNVVFDCDSMYLLKANKIIKFSLPDLNRTNQVDLPLNTNGREIKLVGSCSDPTQALLVIGNKRPLKDSIRGRGLLLLSYDEDLNLISSKNIKEELEKEVELFD